MPAAKAKAKDDETIIMIGDNLASHLNEDLILFCYENNIRPIFFIPNSTHLTQPLDVAFFKPLKVAWRQLLLDFKEKEEGSINLPKDLFPRLLKDLCETVGLHNNANLISGFRATGIYPLDRQKVLDMLMSSEQYDLDTSVLSDGVMEMLKKRLEGNSNKRPKKTKLNIKPGESATNIFSQSEASTSGCQTTTTSNQTTTRGGKSTSLQFSDSESDIDNDLESFANDSDTEPTEVLSEQSQTKDKNNVQKIKGIIQVTKDDLKIGDYVLVQFKAEQKKDSKFKFFIGSITHFYSRVVLSASFMRKFGKSNNVFVYPDPLDDCIFDFDNVLGKLNPPEIIHRDKYKFVNVDSSQFI